MQTYLALAETLYQNPNLETTLDLTHLEPCTRTCLNELVQHARRYDYDQPRRSWAVMTVAYQMACQTEAVLLQAEAAWELAVSSNAWLRPGRVQQALSLAQPLFQAHNQTGWVAACLWQKNAQPWTTNDFQKAEQELQTALHGLENSEQNHLAPACQLSLAYAQLLQRKDEQALGNLQASQQADPSPLHQANCHLIHASYLRRLSKYDEAKTLLETVQEEFAQLNLPVQIAKAYYQIALGQAIRGQDSQQAEQLLLTAINQFQQADLPLWEAQCANILAHLCQNQGRLTEAETHLTQTREIYAGYNIWGLQADNLLDIGHLTLYKGQLFTSLDYLTQASHIYSQQNLKRLAALGTVYEGYVNFQLGRYQRALHLLEQSEKNLTNYPDRWADCALRLGEVWLALERPDLTLSYVLVANRYFQESQRLHLLGEGYRLLVEARYKQGEPLQNNLSELQAILKQLQGANLWPVAGTIQVLLGTIWFALNKFDKSLISLLLAKHLFAQTGMYAEQANCEVLLGRVYYHLNQLSDAKQVWLQAIDSNQAVMPTITWQASAGLAQLHEQASEFAQAWAHYQTMVNALGQLRQWVWQPSLVGGLWQEPARYLDKAVRIGAHYAPGRDTLQAIEVSKAQAFNQQLLRTISKAQGLGLREQNAVSELKEKVAVLEGEIQWFQHELAHRFREHVGRLRPPQEMQFRRQLREKLKEYDGLMGRLERTNDITYPRSTFHLATFRRQAQAHLDDNWLAVNYYLTDEELYIVCLTPHTCQVVIQPIPYRIQAILDTLTNLPPFTADQLTALGHWLIPNFVLAQITPDTHLLIVPHRSLHNLPWAALRPGQPLVTLCIPSLSPSLTSLTLLWQRTRPSQPLNGLILAVSHFNGRQPDLPSAEIEATLIAEAVHNRCDLLVNEQATWTNLNQQTTDKGLADYTFWHIASHASHDPIVGRLCRLALFDQDVWLDALWELAPLPSLVTIAACSGSRSRVYQGDEHVGLASTCLAAGTNTVIGSSRPVYDTETARLMKHFYIYWVTGNNPAHALALAQREALIQNQKEKSYSWETFACLGSPV